MQDPTVSSDAFVRAARESFEAILAENPELFALYDIRQFTHIQNADLDSARRVLTITY